MDVLTVVIKLVEYQGLFHAFEKSGVRHRLSLFVDDVVMFIKPTREEATTALQLVGTFGVASGLRCNLAKSSASPIRCTEQELLDDQVHGARTAGHHASSRLHGETLPSTVLRAAIVTNSPIED
jgi:hypothetical protein